ncbi:MAG: sigma-54-dependent transcriptional regulator [Candidatus Brocadiales bacterium]
MSIQRILAVDDEEDMLEVYEDILAHLKDVQVSTTKSSEKAEKLLQEKAFDLLITDLRMPGPDGIGLLKKVKEFSPETLVLLITGFPTIETAVESVKLGAFDYIVKPFPPDRFLTTVSKALEQKRLLDENRLLTRQLEKDYKFDNIIGQTSSMQKIFEIIQQIADTESDVLLVGESGTGKELIARSIHTRSNRKRGRFIPIDCGAIPSNLLESEVFGYERGAFTGAYTTSLGLMELAHGGTLFLDEMCELPLSLQAKLLRALQERTFRRIGGREEIQVDVRVIAATNKNIENEVKERRFREDLYYRINVIKILVPPLRDRTEDIPLLVSHFLSQYANDIGKDVKGVDTEVMEVLKHYTWQGNVRELQNVLKRAVTLTKHETLTLDDLPEEVVTRSTELQNHNSTVSTFFKLRAQRLASFEHEYLRRLLTRHKGDVAGAAVEAMIPRGTFYRLMNKYHLRSETFKA